MNRASARSKSLMSAPAADGPPGARFATMSASLRLTPAMRSRIAACSPGSRRPAAPKSISEATVGEQHDVAGMRVGVEHVLQHLLEEGAQQVVGELLPGAWPRPTRHRAVPSSHSMTSREVVSESCTCGIDARVGG